MTRSELVERLGNRLGCGQEKSGLIVKLILEAVGDTLKKGGRVEIRGFGSFSLRSRQARVARNPRTGEKIQVPGKTVPFFKVSKELRERVNGGKQSR
jgi:integration host factor subunit beta